MSFSIAMLHAKTIDLKEAIAYAVANNIQLKAAFSDKSLRLHEIKVLKQKFDPELSLNVSLSAQHEDYFDEDIDEKKIHTYPTMRLHTPIGTQIEVFTEQNLGYEKYQRKSGIALRVVVEQPLLQGRKKIVNTWTIESAQILNEIEELLLKQSIEQVIYNVIVNYHALQLAQENVKSHERWLEQSKQFYSNLQEKVDSGRAPQSDLSASMAQVKQAQLQLAQANYNFRQAKRKLLEIINCDDTDLHFVPDYSKHGSHFSKEEYKEVIIANDVESKVYHLNKERMEKQLIVVKDQQLIDVRLRGDWTIGRYHVYGPNKYTGEIYDDNTYNYPFIHQNGNYSAHLLMSVPITGKDNRYHQVMAVKLELDKLEQEALFHQKQLTGFIDGLLELVALKKEQIQLSSDAVKLAKTNYDNALMKLDAGRTSIFEVVSLQQKLHDTQVTHNEALIAYLDVQASLELRTGTLASKWL